MCVCVFVCVFSWDGGIIHHYFEIIYELDPIRFRGQTTYIYTLKMNQMSVVHLHSNCLTILFMTSTNFHPKQFSRGFPVVSVVPHMKSTRILAPILITLQELISLRRGGQGSMESQVTLGLEIPDFLLFTSKTHSFLQGPLMLRVDS